MTVEEIYAAHVKPLPVEEQLRLLALTARELAERDQQSPATPASLAPTNGLHRRTGRANRKWTEIAGAAPHPLVGEDAQAWISRGRLESDR